VKTIAQSTVPSEWLSIFSLYQRRPFNVTFGFALDPIQSLDDFRDILRPLNAASIILITDSTRMTNQLLVFQSITASHLLSILSLCNLFYQLIFIFIFIIKSLSTLQLSII